jgi:hypothetical protein
MNSLRSVNCQLFEAGGKFHKSGGYLKFNMHHQKQGFVKVSGFPKGAS